LHAEQAAPVYDDRPTDEEPLLAVADPVLRALEQDTAGMDAAFVVADARGRIIARHGHDHIARGWLGQLGVAPGFVWGEEHVGTNAIGTALAHRAAVLVAGDEHFADLVTGMSGGGAPVTDSFGTQPIGAVAILRRAHDTSHLLVTVARQAARDIEHRLRAAATERERALHEAFVRAVRHATTPVALVAPEALLTDSAAARMLGPSAGSALWSIVSDAATGKNPTNVLVPLADGRWVVARCEAVREGTEVVAVILLLPPEPPGVLAPLRRGGRSRSGHGRFGWESLSKTELVVADLAARGRTNREIADTLIVSPHTVDSHVRHIYGKLGISSRVALTRVVLANGGTSASQT
jgi:DNA-binding CsgD family transcriptional regulator